jgi:hypothetical protein
VTLDSIPCHALFWVTRDRVVCVGRHGVENELRASGQLEGAEAALQCYCLVYRASSCRSERDKKEKEGSTMAGEGRHGSFLTLFRRCILYPGDLDHCRLCLPVRTPYSVDTR